MKYYVAAVVLFLVVVALVGFDVLVFWSGDTTGFAFGPLSVYHDQTPGMFITGYIVDPTDPAAWVPGRSR